MNGLPKNPVIGKTYEVRCVASSRSATICGMCGCDNASDNDNDNVGESENETSGSNARFSQWVYTLYGWICERCYSVGLSLSDKVEHEALFLQRARKSSLEKSQTSTPRRNLRSLDVDELEALGYTHNGKKRRRYLREGYYQEVAVKEGRVKYKPCVFRVELVERTNGHRRKYIQRNHMPDGTITHGAKPGLPASREDFEQCALRMWSLVKPFTSKIETYSHRFSPPLRIDEAYDEALSCACNVAMRFRASSGDIWPLMLYSIRRKLYRKTQRANALFTKIIAGEKVVVREVLMDPHDFVASANVNPQLSYSLDDNIDETVDRLTLPEALDYCGLTQRERHTILELAKGRTLEDIGIEYGVIKQTVHVWKKKAIKKLLCNLGTRRIIPSDV